MRENNKNERKTASKLEKDRVMDNAKYIWEREDGQRKKEIIKNEGGQQRVKGGSARHTESL